MNNNRNKFIITGVVIVLVILFTVLLMKGQFNSEKFRNKHCNEYSLHKKQFSSNYLTSPIWPYSNRDPDYYDNYHDFSSERQMHTNPLNFRWGFREYPVLPH